MGQALLRLASERPDLEVVAAVSRKVASRVVDGIPQFATSELGGVPAFDVAIDFSLPEGFDAILEACRSRRAALVSGTTGLSEQQLQAIRNAAAEIPVLWSANFSLGVAVLSDLVERAASALRGWDCDIVESHHVHKKDAPSGTAANTARRIAAARNAAALGPPPDATVQELPGARGAQVDGIRVHGVRLRGLVAHQEVLFGAEGAGWISRSMGAMLLAATCLDK